VIVNDYYKPSPLENATHFLAGECAEMSYKPSPLENATHFLAGGLSPNKSKINNGWKCINALQPLFILSLLGL